MIDEFKRAGVNPRDVSPQSFNLADVLYWITHEPALRQTGRVSRRRRSRRWHSAPDRRRAAGRARTRACGSSRRRFRRCSRWTQQQHSSCRRSTRKDIKAAGLGIITWSFERADLRRGAAFGGFYAAYDPEGRVVKKDSDMYLALDALAQDVGIIGVFSDWPATVSYYASCMGLE